MQTRERGRSLRSRIAQAWIRLRADDPAATSALAVVTRELEGGSGLRTLQRWRLVELTGSLPGAEALEAHLHGSTQFFNPHKEICRVRLHAKDPVPLPSDAHAILVVDRDDDRRPAAERWWRHETGKRVMVREGTVWALEFATGFDGSAAAHALCTVQDRQHGLFCNPHAQDARIVVTTDPLPWIASKSRRGVGT